MYFDEEIQIFHQQGTRYRDRAGLVNTSSLLQLFSFDQIENDPLKNSVE